MDEMQDYELGSFIENIPYTDINNWETCRMQIFTISLIMSKKQLSPKDIMKFPWDEQEEKPDTSITNEQIIEMEKKVKEIQSKYYA